MFDSSERHYGKMKSSASCRRRSAIDEQRPSSSIVRHFEGNEAEIKSRTEGEEGSTLKAAFCETARVTLNDLKKYSLIAAPSRPRQRLLFISALNDFSDHTTNAAIH